MALREAAVRQGLHVSEYGVLDDADGVTHRCATETEVYELLGMEYIEPELRENRGELEAATRNELPELVTDADLKGDLHCHTTASDGTASIEEMAAAAAQAGYEYLAITDHSASMGFGADLSPDELRRQIDRIRSTTVDGIELLAGSEVNILTDGSLDYDDDILAQLDWVIASVHSSFRMTAENMTRRIVGAIEHPLVDCIGHLSGRKIERRAPYEFDLERVLAGVRRHWHDARDQREPGPTRHQRHDRAGGRKAGHSDRDRLRCPPRRWVRGRPLRRRDRAPRLAHRRAGGEYAAVG